MAADLLKLLDKFLPVHDRETHHAFFKTHVPAVAPEAFLNIIFKATSADVRMEIERKLTFPVSMVDFFCRYNGAILFSDALRIYGCLSETYLLNRSDTLSCLPYDISRTNDEFREELQNRNMLCIGSYGYDRSLICINRKTSQIICFQGQEFAAIRASWSNIDHWLTAEISRLSFYFDDQGNRLVPELELLPKQTPITI